MRRAVAVKPSVLIKLTGCERAGVFPRSMHLSAMEGRMPFKNITGKQEAVFLSSLRAGQYNLLLGAGFSMDSTNAKGKLPSGNQLLDELAAVTKGRKTTLQRLYQMLTPAQVKENITDRLSGCEPGETAKLMSSFIWRRVFTWNVDDVLENLYRGDNTLQRAVPKHFNDVYVDPSSLEELLVIHLHGFVGQPDRGYVFSREQYVKQQCFASGTACFISSATRKTSSRIASQCYQIRRRQRISFLSQRVSSFLPG